MLLPQIKLKVESSLRLDSLFRAAHTVTDLAQGCSHFFSMRATDKINKSKRSTYYKNATHIFIDKYFDFKIYQNSLHVAMQTITQTEQLET